VDWGGVGCDVSVDDVAEAEAAGAGRLLSIHNIGDRTGSGPGAHSRPIQCALKGKHTRIQIARSTLNLGIDSSISSYRRNSRPI